MIWGLGNRGRTRDQINGQLWRQIEKLIKENINKFAYDKHIIRSMKILRFSNRQGDKARKKSSTTRTYKVTCLKKR